MGRSKDSEGGKRKFADIKSWKLSELSMNGNLINEAPSHNKTSVEIGVVSCQKCFFLSSYSKVSFDKNHNFSESKLNFPLMIYCFMELY